MRVQKYDFCSDFNKPTHSLPVPVADGLMAMTLPCKWKKVYNKKLLHLKPNKFVLYF